MTVAQTFPASREIVENSAAAKANPRPISESRNLTHTSAFEDCSHSATRLGTDTVDFNGLAMAEPTVLSLASVKRTDNPDQVAGKAFVTLPSGGKTRTRG